MSVTVRQYSSTYNESMKKYDYMKSHKYCIIIKSIMEVLGS